MATHPSTFLGYWLTVLSRGNDEVVELKKEGLSDAEIARRVGISKQRVSQILHPKPKIMPKTIKPLEKQMLRASEAARLLGIHVNTIRRWSDAGILKVYRISARGDRRFRLKDIEHFLRLRR